MAGRIKASVWRRAFLRALARTGNARVSAREAGVDPGTAYDHRIKDAGFAAKWAQALAKAKERPSPASRRGSKGPELVLRRTKHGDQLVRAGAGRWNAAADAIFFAELGRTGCVRAAARACGFSTNALYARRENYPEFARRWNAIEARATQRLPGLLRAASIASLDPEVDGEDLPKVNVDQAIRIAALKGGGAGDGRRGARLDPAERERREQRNKAELTQSILKGLEVLKKRKLAQGWTESEEGRLVPPGWVRAP